MTRTDEVRQTDVTKLLLTELENSLWTSSQGKTVGWGRERYGMQNNKRDGAEMKKAAMGVRKIGKVWDVEKNKSKRGKDGQDKKGKMEQWPRLLCSENNKRSPKISQHMKTV